MATAPGKVYPGDNQRIDVLFYDNTGALTDPSEVRFKTMSPCGTSATYTYGTDTNLVRAVAGEYLIDFVVTEAGRWRWRWEATGLSTPFVKEGNLIVQYSPFYDDYGTDYAL